MYDRVIKCHNTRDDISAIPSMSRNSNNNMPWNVFNVHTDVSIDAKLFTYEICMYDIKHFFQSTPQCARSACIVIPLIDVLLLDLSKQNPWLPQLPDSLATSWDSSFSLLNFSFRSSSKALPDSLQAGMSSSWKPRTMLRNRRVRHTLL